MVRIEEMKKLMDDGEMLADVAAYHAAKARIASGEDELIPLEFTERRLAGESTVKIWREYRGLTQEGQGVQSITVDDRRHRSQNTKRAESRR